MAQVRDSPDYSSSDAEMQPPIQECLYVHTPILWQGAQLQKVLKTGLRPGGRLVLYAGFQRTGTRSTIEGARIAVNIAMAGRRTRDCREFS
jgi:hypothetical protein